MASIKKRHTTEPRLKFNTNNFFANLYVAVMFTLFPLFLSEYYGKVRRDKFWMFFGITVVISIIILAVTAYNFFINHKKVKFNFSVTDYAFFAFVGIGLVSTLAAGDRVLHCFMGLNGNNSNSGRNMGLLMFILLLIMYLIISRLFYFKKIVFYAIFVGVSIVTLLSIVNYYYIDPLGIFSMYQDNEWVINNFTSTIGNKNYLSAFICVALPFSVGIAITAAERKLKIIANISTAIQFMGLIVANSDGGFFGIIALMFVLPVVISRNSLKLSKLFFSLTVMVIGANTLRIFDLILDGKSKGYSGISQIFMEGYLSVVLMVTFAALTAIFALLHIKRKGEPLPKFVFYIALGTAVFAALVVASVIVYYTFINKTAQLAGFKSFFRFDKDWGTHRGFFWINSFDVWANKFNLWQKLFGSGPETFYYSFSPYFAELKSLYGETASNAAHNVYINTLITHGILGFLAYGTLVASSIVRAIKGTKNNSLAFVCLLVIITYAVQDFVNIANPINTPLFFVFIALVEASYLPANSEENLIKEKF